MKQTPCQKIYSEDKKIVLYADNETSLGAIHDFLLHVKGEIVDRILKAQEDETKAANASKEKKEEVKKPEEKK